MSQKIQGKEYLNERFLLGLAVGLGLGMVIGISIGAIMRSEQKPMTPEEEKRRKKLFIAGIAITLLVVIALALVGWLIEI